MRGSADPNLFLLCKPFDPGTLQAFVNMTVSARIASGPAATPSLGLSGITAAFLLASAQNWHQQRSQDANDAEYNQQFNESKALFRFTKPGAVHGSSFPCAVTAGGSEIAR